MIQAAIKREWKHHGMRDCLAGGDIKYSATDSNGIWWTTSALVQRKCLVCLWSHDPQILVHNLLAWCLQVFRGAWKKNLKSKSIGGILIGSHNELPKDRAWKMDCIGHMSLSLYCGAPFQVMIGAANLWALFSQISVFTTRLVSM